MIDRKSFEIDQRGPVVDLSLEKTEFTRSKLRMNLKSQLRFYLDRSGMTAVQLSKKSGVSKQVLSLWLSGGNPRNLDQVKKVAEIMGTSIDNLCYGRGVEDKNQFDVSSVPEDEWLGGVFEVKFRRVKERK